jgi:hypothetical protein
MNLNLFKNFIINFFEDIHLHPKADALLELIDKTCTNVSEVHTYELKQGQWPYDPINDHHNYTAEESQHFVVWILPLLLNKLDSNIYKFSKTRSMIGHLFIDIAQFIFNWTRGKGWNADDLQLVLQAVQK